MEKIEFASAREAYEYIYQEEKGIAVRQGHNQDKASRIANIKAVQNAWIIFNLFKKGK